MHWQLLNPSIVDDLNSLDQLLLANRQVKAVGEFFQPRHPSQLTLREAGLSVVELKKIQRRLQRAKKKQEKIIIFGDYDADGITATTILWESLYALGYKVLPFIPNRLQHGYGLSIAALKDLLKQDPQVKLIITVDNGIVAEQALQFLAKQNIDAIVTDHHQKDGKNLPAIAVFHTQLTCGAAVAWFLARELIRASDLTADEQANLITRGLELLAIAIVTDLLPLQGINRNLLFHALQAFRRSQRPGLSELINLAGLKKEQLDTYAMGFVIGPRLNAMGRLANANDALRLLCTNSPQRAKQLAQALQSINSQRQDLTTELLAQVKAEIKEQPEEAMVIVAGDYHEGVIGLLAGKLTEEFSKPSIVISNTGKVAKASARSLADFNITEFIRLFQNDLLEVGGHPLAAGFSLLAKKIPALRRKMLAKAKKLLTGKKLSKTLSIDTELADSLVKLSTAQHLEKFAPFGLANPQPNFLLRSWQLLSVKSMGKKQEHQKLLFKDKAGQLQEVLAFQAERRQLICQPGQSYDLVLELGSQVWQQRPSLQLLLKARRPAQK